MSAAQLSRCVAMLLLLGAALATVPGRPTVMDVRAGRSPRPEGVSVSIASASQAGPSRESYGEEKEFCLLETNRRACGHAEDSGTGSDGDVTSYYYTSEISCCPENNDYGHGDSADLTARIRSPTGTVGSCDWTLWYAEDEYGYISDQIDRMGSASAICYMGPDSDNCGGPFCDRMVMTLQGTLYYLYYVYSYWGEAFTENDNCYSLYADPRLAANGRGDRSNGTTTTRHAKKNAHTPGASREERRASRRTKGAARAAESRASTQYNRENDVSQWQEKRVYVGEATVINGAVTNMAGPIKDKWDSGTFEYVAYFDNQGEETGGIDATYAWVRDKAYKFTFFRQGNYY